MYVIGQQHFHMIALNGIYWDCNIDKRSLKGIKIEYEAPNWCRRLE